MWDSPPPPPITTTTTLHPSVDGKSFNGSTAVIESLVLVHNVDENLDWQERQEQRDKHCVTMRVAISDKQSDGIQQSINLQLPLPFARTAPPPPPPISAHA